MKKAGRFVWNVIKFVLGWVLLVFGVGALATDTASFPAVEAEVVAVIEETYVESDLPSYKIEYVYLVDGVSHTSTLISRTEIFVGETRTIYYNPANPQEIFATQSGKRTEGLIGLGLGAYLVGSPAWQWWKQRKAKGQPPQAAPTPV